MAKITVKYQLATEFDVGTPIAKAEIYSRHTEFQTFSPAGGEFRKSLTPDWITSWINGNEFTAIVSPEAYTAGDEFIRITIGNQVLTAKMPEDISYLHADGQEGMPGNLKIRMTYALTSANEFVFVQVGQQKKKMSIYCVQSYVD